MRKSTLIARSRRSSAEPPRCIPGIRIGLRKLLKTAIFILRIEKTTLPPSQAIAKRCSISRMMLLLLSGWHKLWSLRTVQARHGSIIRTISKACRMDPMRLMPTKPWNGCSRSRRTIPSLKTRPKIHPNLRANAGPELLYPQTKDCFVSGDMRRGRTRGMKIRKKLSIESKGLSSNFHGQGATLDPMRAPLPVQMQVLAGGGINGNAQFVLAIDHVPDSGVITRAPLQSIADGQGGFFFQQGLPAVVLRDLEGLVGITAQESDVEDLCGKIIGAETVFGTGRYAARRSIQRIGA